MIWITRTAQALLALLDLAVNLIGLALALRILLPWFKMRSDHPIYRLVYAITEPLLRVVRRHVHRPLMWMTPQFYLDLTPLVAFFFLWLVDGALAFLLRLLIVPPLWLFNPLGDLGLWVTSLLALVFDLYIYAIFVRVLLELIGTPLTQPLMNFLWNLTEPVMAPTSGGGFRPWARLTSPRSSPSSPWWWWKWWCFRCCACSSNSRDVALQRLY